MAGRRRRRRARTFRLTRQGKVFVAVTLMLGFAAVNTGNNLLYLVLGLMLSLLLVSGVLSDLVLWGVRVRRDLPHRVFVGHPTLFELALRNQKSRLPSYSLSVRDRSEDEVGDSPCYFLKVEPEEEQSVAYQRTFARRGRLALEGFEVVTRYPFGLIEKGRRFARAAELIVYPELMPRVPEEAAAGHRGSDVALSKVGRGNEIAGLRMYRAGDEARSIHWRRTASRGELVVREHEEEAMHRLTIALDNAAPEVSEGEPTDPAWLLGFEHAVSEAASIATASLAQGGAVEVVTRGARSPIVAPGGTLDPLYRFLALLDPAPPDAPPPGTEGSARLRVVEVRPVEHPIDSSAEAAE